MESIPSQFLHCQVWLGSHDDVAKAVTPLGRVLSEGSKASGLRLLQIQSLQSVGSERVSQSEREREREREYLSYMALRLQGP